jgi:L-asparaginase
MKNLALISLGGTIAMLKNEAGYAMPCLDSKQILEKVGLKTSKNVNIETFSLSNVPSVNISFSLLLELAEKIKELERNGINGVVVTQGTDTLEEVSYFMDLILETSIPVIFTGAQRNPSLPGSDAAMNISDSLTVALDEKASNYGVLVVFNSEIHLAREVIKTHTSKIDTFKSFEFGPVGCVVENRAYWHRQKILFDKVYHIENEIVNVEIVSLGLFSNGNYIDLLLTNGIQGLIIQAMGVGHVPEGCLHSLKKATNMKIPVIVTSRCFSGRLCTTTYGFKGSEKSLREMGAIFNDWLPSSKARIKLIVMLSAGLTYDEIKDNFESNFYV